MRSPIFRRVTVAASMFLAALSAAGCDRTHSGTTDVVVIGDPPAVVDPAAGPLTEPQAVLLSGVAQGLVQFDAAGQIVPSGPTARKSPRSRSLGCSAARSPAEARTR
jgi:hypothetical protein